MSSILRIEVYSHFLFDREMERMKLNDDNVEDNKETAFISIIGTDECLKYYLNEENTTHFFKKNHSNVLNLEFDDLEEDREYNGHLFKALSEAQTNEIYNFIKDGIENGVTCFKIHCRAGVSRSRAVAEFISILCDNVYKIDIDYEERKHFIPYLNQGVIRKLKRLLWNE